MLIMVNVSDKERKAIKCYRYACDVFGDNASFEKHLENLYGDRLISSLSDEQLDALLIWLVSELKIKGRYI